MLVSVYHQMVLCGESLLTRITLAFNFITDHDASVSYTKAKTSPEKKQDPFFGG